MIDVVSELVRTKQITEREGHYLTSYIMRQDNQHEISAIFNR